MTARSQDDDVPWLSPDQQRDWRSLIALLATLPTALDTQLKCQAGLNAFEYHVLAALSGSPDRTLPMSRLASLSQGSLSRLSHAVTRLEHAGWVRRSSCSTAGRRVDARLTDAGWVKLQESAPGHVREARRLVVDALTPEQLAALGEAARVIVSVANPTVAGQLA
ncbi:MarR family winged helix-turn-helix transcriptional regulator [Angustibacter luteus]|uniref:MarR family winged helix-turn-helix transcriptional regulator n=1 Tax=Angustibacter luteus TaxID=658456 RepID=A0ABW1JCS7_9ACTN